MNLGHHRRPDRDRAHARPPAHARSPHRRGDRSQQGNAVPACRRRLATRGQPRERAQRHLDDLRMISSSIPSSATYRATTEDTMSTVAASATRIIDAPCDKVWRAQTEPQHFEQWFGAKPGSARTDPRSGGTWSAVVTPDGKEVELSGQYV